MEITKQKLRELMTKAFKEGQKAYEAEDYPIRYWVEEEIRDCVSQNKQEANK